MTKHRGDDAVTDLTFDWVCQTDASIIVNDDRGRDVVLPKSLVEFERDERAGTVLVTIPIWLAKERELI
jgi:hypothetical protein